MAYRFRLKQVLEYRRGKEEEAKNELASKQHQLKLARHKLDLFKRDKENMEKLWRDKKKNLIDVRELGMIWHYHQYLDKKARQQEENCRQLKNQEQKKRNKLKERWQNRRVIEVFEEKNWQRYLWNLKKVEDKVNDELSLYSFYRKGGDKECD